MSKKIKGFTLAEIMITLGIIGIVAAMTIPTLSKEIQQTQLKTAFKKSYSVVSQAWAQVVAEMPNTFTAKGGGTGCSFPDGTTGDVNANDGRINYLKDKMKVVNTCSLSKGCWADSFEFSSGIPANRTTMAAGSPYYYSWVTSDGMCWTAPWLGSDEANLSVDTNCNQGPNKIGQDIFSFLLGADGMVYFAIDDMSTTGHPVSSGSVCPIFSDPTTINGRAISFRSWL